MAIAAHRRTWSLDSKDEAERLELLLDEGISALDLNVRVVNALEQAGIVSIRDLLSRRPDELLSVRSFGAKTLMDVYMALQQIGIRVPRQVIANAAGKRTKTRASKASKQNADAVLTQAIADLTIIVNNLLDKNPASQLAANILWILSYCQSRQLPVAATTDVKPAEAYAEVTAKK